MAGKSASTASRMLMFIVNAPSTIIASLKAAHSEATEDAKGCGQRRPCDAQQTGVTRASAERICRNGTSDRTLLHFLPWLTRRRQLLIQRRHSSLDTFVISRVGGDLIDRRCQRTFLSRTKLCGKCAQVFGD